MNKHSFASIFGIATIVTTATLPFHKIGTLNGADGFRPQIVSHVDRQPGSLSRFKGRQP